MPLVLLAGCAALAVESFAARAQTGSNINDLLPAYLAVALLAGLAMAGQPALVPSRTRGRHTAVTRWHRGAGRQWVPVVVSALIVVQIGVLAGGFRLSQAFPPKADRIADQRLMAGMRALGGTVAIPADPGIAVTAGLPPTEDRSRRRTSCALRTGPPRRTSSHSLAQAVAAQAVQRHHHRVPAGTCGASRRTCRSTTTAARRRRWTASCPFRFPRTPRPCLFPYGYPSGTGPPAPRSPGRSSPRSLR